MKNIKLSVVALLAMSNLLMAGGDLSVVTPYEIMDERNSEIIPIQPVIQVQAPQRIVVPAPVVIPDADISSIYVGLGLAAARYDTNCNTGCKKDAVDKTGGVLIRAGYDFNKYMGVEARGMVTSVKEDGGKVQHYGVFAKPMIPVTDGLNAYGLVGIAKTTTSGTMRKTDVSGLAFGAGLEYDLSSDKKKDAKYDREFDGKGDQEKGLGIFADYERLYYKKNSPDLDAVSVGVTYDF